MDPAANEREGVAFEDCEGVFGVEVAEAILADGEERHTGDVAGEPRDVGGEPEAVVPGFYGCQKKTLYGIQEVVGVELGTLVS